MRQKGGFRFKDPILCALSLYIISKIWQLGDEYILGVLKLFATNFQHLLPGIPQALWGRRKVVGDCSPQFGHIKERDGWKHVVFNMILHIPIKEGRQPFAGVASATESKIWRIGSEAEMLRRTA